MAVYAAIGVITVLVLRGLSRRWREGKPEEVELPYGPPPEAPASGASS